MDDALKLAHDLYYPGGSEAGYDYHADDSGLYYGLIYKLWGINRDAVPFIKSDMFLPSDIYVSISSGRFASFCR